MFIVAFPRSPHAYAIRGREVQVLARFDAERLIPRVELRTVSARYSSGAWPSVTIRWRNAGSRIF